MVTVVDGVFSVQIVIPDELVSAPDLSAESLRRAVAARLYHDKVLTLSQAAEFAQMDRLDFHHFLADRRIPLNYDAAALQHDIQALAEWNPA